MSTIKSDNDDISLGERVKLARKVRGYTQEMLANKLEISKDYVSRIEKNERHPAPHLKKAIEHWLEETPEENLLRTYKGTVAKSTSMGWKNEQGPSGQSGGPESEHNIPASEMLIMTSVVLESNTVYRSALASNIRAFYQAVKGEREMNDLRDEIKKMREELAEMKELMLSQGTAEKKRAGNDD